MKQVSYWARHHVAAARIIIILLYIPLNILAYLTGALLWDVQVELSPSFINSVAILVVVLYICYRKKASYYQKKLFQFAIGICTFCIICFYGNQSRTANLYIPISGTTQAVSIIDNQPVSVENEKNKTKKESRQLKKQLKKQFKKAIADEEGMKPWVKILLIVLTVAVAILLLYGLALLACTLSCNGAEAAAWVVAILGLAGIIAGLFFVIRGIVGRKKRAKQQASAN
ncbi:hypothetical protein ESA94_08295 [Lacibacter luteus]|uniref:Uncharacterized protein n=1 Tax=Lacibacter luteus TaxID=2508719 RepID=A0A4Q1CIQ6_9BACT|nr:hypothetical protein [Lacibacter luteus]RXK60459.1 hypothetical protein ESA94_08295 [Lacibacter luteus]